MAGIQTEACAEGTLDVGWIDTGDWFEYNINVQTAGSYIVEYRVASQFATGKVALIVGGERIRGGRRRCLRGRGVQERWGEQQGDERQEGQQV